MWKWVFLIALKVVLLIVAAFIFYIWVAMAGSLQNQVEDNLTLLRQDLILRDRGLSFSYESNGVEMNGLSPSVALSQPRIILKDGGVEYRLSAEELSVIGSFFQLDDVVLSLPNKMQLTIKQPGQTPRNIMLDLDGSPQLHLQTLGGESHMFEYYQLKNTASGKLVAIDSETNISAPAINYILPKTDQIEIGSPYSQHLLRFLRIVAK